MGPKLLLLVASTILVLLFGEFSVRIIAPYVGWRQFEDVGLGWSSKEYQVFEPGPKPDGVTRMLFLGDSYLAGAGLESLDERFPVLLGERLGDEVEVAVLASTGWGTDQEFLAYIQKGRAWQPDVVVLVFCANNDLANILSNVHGRRARKPYFVLDQDQELQLFSATGEPLDFSAYREQQPGAFQSYLLDLVRFLLRSEESVAVREDAGDLEGADPRYRRFHLPSEKRYELWSETELSWSPEVGVNQVSAYLHEDFPTNTYQWALFEALLGQLASAVEESGSRLAVMLMPVSYRPRDLRFVVGSAYEQWYATPAGGFTFRAAEPRDRLARAAARAGVAFIDPTAEFLADVHRGRLESTVWPDPSDPHFSATGHWLLAEQLARYWTETFVPAKD